jgi:4-carboxymuconolactone decarboxylase
MTRLPVLHPAELDASQRDLYDRIAGGPRAAGPQLFALTDVEGGLNGPFNAMLYAPPVGDALQALGAAVRYGTTMSDRIREIAILAVAAHWDSEFERYAHEAVGRAAGLTEAEIAALRDGTGEAFDEPTELAALTLVRALLSRSDLDDIEYGRAHTLLGPAMIVELSTLVGYYGTLALQLRIFRIGSPA